ncbi:MAG: hypothetical protein ACP5NY_04240 [Thermocladium sp.]
MRIKLSGSILVPTLISSGVKVLGEPPGPLAVRRGEGIHDAAVIIDAYWDDSRRELILEIYRGDRSTRPQIILEWSELGPELQWALREELRKIIQ